HPNEVVPFAVRFEQLTADRHVKVRRKPRSQHLERFLTQPQRIGGLCPVRAVLDTRQCPPQSASRDGGASCVRDRQCGASGVSGGVKVGILGLKLEIRVIVLEGGPQQCIVGGL